MIILSYFHATVADLIVVIAIIVIINMDINDYKRHRNQEKQWLRTYQMCVTDGLTFCSSSSALPCRSSNLSPRSKTLSMLSFTTSFNSSTCWFIVSIAGLSDISFFYLRCILFFYLGFTYKELAGYNFEWHVCDKT